MIKPAFPRPAPSAGFTLVELLPAMTIAIILIVLLARMVQMASFAWTHGDDQAETYTGARASMDLLSRDIQGAVVDLDFGFRLQNVKSGNSGAQAPHNYSLTFLTHCAPTASSGTIPINPNSVMKVCYQLGWADNSLFPKIQPTYSSGNPIPVLVRTVSTYLDDVFIVTGTSPGEWVNNFANISANPLQTGTIHSITDQEGVTEILAENVLGMEIHPVYWDTTQSPPLAVASPGSTSSDPNGYYSNYLTSGSTSSSFAAPRALDVQLAVVPTRSVPILSHYPAWSSVFSQQDLFSILQPSNTSTEAFHTQLQHSIHYFASTIYLQSKTP